MKRSLSPLAAALAVVSVGSLSANASAQTFYPSRAAWNGAFPGATLEDFEDANAPAGTITACSDFVNASTSDGCFNPGDVAPGVTFSAPGQSNDGTAMVGNGAYGGTNGLIANYFPQSLQVDFSPPVYAVAVDLVSVFSDGTVTATAYDGGGGFVFADDEFATGPGTFWGFSSTTPIGRLVVHSASDQAEGVDNVSYVAFRCGDGIVTSPEACDTSGESTSCDDDCSAVSCGDGNTNEAAGEQCDSGGPSAGCDGDCTFVSCGDGVTNGAVGEACDDGGQSAACDADCTPAVCGDGTVNASAGEACDEGAPSETCNAGCRIPGCGDGVVGAGEECDEGDQTASCDADCSFASCGDGFVNTDAGEGCDGGGETPACNADCTPSICGDRIVNASAGEQCDDGGTVAGDGCSPGCQEEGSGAGGGGAGGAGGGSDQGVGSTGSSGDGGDPTGGPTAGPNAGPSVGPSAGPSAGPTASVDAASGAGGDDGDATGSGDDSGDDSGAGGTGDAAAASDGCGCEVPGAPASHRGILGVIAAGLVAALRRRAVIRPRSRRSTG